MFRQAWHLEHEVQLFICVTGNASASRENSNPGTGIYWETHVGMAVFCEEVGPRVSRGTHDAVVVHGGVRIGS